MANKNNVSQTAMLIASLRALACYEDDALIHGNDYLAELFLPEDKRIPLKTGSILSFDFQHRDNENTLIDTGLKDESIKFGLNVQECDNYLHSLGYSVIEKVDAEAMSNRYLTMVSRTGFGYGKDGSYPPGG
jgi:O-methyltransferase involved in polyketide biosynthesis